MADQQTQKRGMTLRSALTTIGVLVGIVASLIAIFTWLGTLSPQETVAEPGPSATPAPVAPEPAIDAVTEPLASVAPPAILASFRFIPGITGSSMGRDKTVDGGLPVYEMWAGKLSISYTWAGVMSDNTQAEGTWCSMRIDIAGPVTIPAHTDNECSPDPVSAFSSIGHRLELTVAGEYTLTATDMITGATGSTTITVQPGPANGS